MCFPDESLSFQSLPMVLLAPGGAIFMVDATLALTAPYPILENPNPLMREPCLSDVSEKLGHHGLG